MATRVYTFGFDHKHPETAQSLSGMYVIINGATATHCRAEMLNRFGQDWAFEYHTTEHAGVEKFSLRELPSAEWPQLTYRFYIDTDGEIREY